MDKQTKAPEMDKQTKAPVLLHYDYWDADGNRHPAGDVIDIPTADAKALIKEGKADRADPMPGEE